MMSYHDVTWRHDVVPWRYVTSCRDVHDVRCHDKLALCNSPIWNFRNHVFQPGDLDLWPSNSSEISSRSTPPPNFGHTHTHTQAGPILYPRPLTREGIMIRPLESYGMSKRAVGGSNATVTMGRCVGYLQIIEEIKSYKPEVKASISDRRLRSYGHLKFCLFSY